MLLANLRFLASLPACTAPVFARGSAARPLARLVMSGRGHADRMQRRLVAAVRLKRAAASLAARWRQTAGDAGCLPELRVAVVRLAPRVMVLEEIRGPLRSLTWQYSFVLGLRAFWSQPQPPSNSAERFRRPSGEFSDGVGCRSRRGMWRWRFRADQLDRDHGPDGGDCSADPQGFV